MRVVSARRFTEQAVQALYSFGSIHVTRSKAFGEARPLPSLKTVSECLVELRAGKRLLENSSVKERGEVKAPSSHSLAGLAKEFQALGLESVRAGWARVESSRQRFAEASGLRRKIEPFSGLSVAPSALAESERVGFVFFKLKTGFGEFEKALRHGGLKAKALSSNGFALVAFDKLQAENVAKVVSRHSVQSLEIPRVGEKSFQAAFGKAVEAEGRARSELDAACADFDALKKGLLPSVEGLVSAFEEREREALLPTKFSESDYLVAVEGWVPVKLKAELEREVSRVTEGAFVFEEVAASETPPSLFDHSPLLQPFGALVRFFSMPRGGEVDPTALVALSFPLFFGMILGDVGYGVVGVLAAAAGWLKFKKGFLKDLSGVMFYSSLSATAFGFVYGEFLGFSNILGWQLVPVIHRMRPEGLALLMSLSVVMGFLHLALGFALGFWSNWAQGHRTHAFAKIAWLAIELGLVMALTSAVGISFFALFKPVAALLPASAWGGLAVLGLIALLKFEGVPGLLELPGLFANLFSYLRIMALGLSGVIIALIINSIPLKPSLDPVGFLSFALFAVAFTVCHALALALGLFEASIQSLRLHYVEFFSKFYRGGGVPFTPLRDRQT